MNTNTQTNNNRNPDCFRFLVTTDNHLGYMERDPKRSEDSFLAFEECLNHGRVTYDCDAVLLGGDLFHENKPSLSCLKRTITLFRKYCMGDRDIQFELRTDPAINFPTHPNHLANFQDPNLNIALPVFTIHGNHDDPVSGGHFHSGSGTQQQQQQQQQQQNNSSTNFQNQNAQSATTYSNYPVSAIDILSSSGLVNYFGHVPAIHDMITVRPVLVRKGNTNIALYGMGNVRDERLHRAFRMNNVKFVRPHDDEENMNNNNNNQQQQQGGGGGRIRYFKILVLHQNRGVRAYGSKNGISEQMLKGAGLDLVIWGNEHEQVMMGTAIEGLGFDVVQPGSTIHTSIHPNEQNPKQCAVLEIIGDKYRLIPHTLNHVRPSIRRTVELHKIQGISKTLDNVEDYLRRVTDEMIIEADEQVKKIPDFVLRANASLKLPLMRLSVDFSDPNGGLGAVNFPQPNYQRFGQSYVQVACNPSDLLKAIKPTVARTNRLKNLQNLQRNVLNPTNDADTNDDDTNNLLKNNNNNNGNDNNDNNNDNFLPVDDIRSKISSFLKTHAKDKCQLFSENEIGQAVYNFVEKGEKNAIEETLENLMVSSQRYIWQSLGKEVEAENLNEQTLYQLALKNKEEVNKRSVGADDHDHENDDDDDNLLMINQNQNRKNKGNQQHAPSSPGGMMSGQQQQQQNTETTKRSLGDRIKDLHERVTKKDQAPTATGHQKQRRGREGDEVNNKNDGDGDISAEMAILGVQAQTQNNNNTAPAPAPKGKRATGKRAAGGKKAAAVKTEDSAGTGTNLAFW